jgi:hypothetical protein
MTKNALQENGGIDALTRAEIDIQIATAHAYPRSIEKANRRIVELVTMSKEVAESCVFSLPRGGKPIVGPSIRMAEILFSQWGNCTGGSRVVEVNKQAGYLEAEGVFHDLEANAKSVKRVRRSILDKTGKPFNADMITVTGNAACSIAFRNAVLAGVPRAVWDRAYETALRLIRGDMKTLPERRDAAMKAMAAFGLSSEDVCKIIRVVGPADITIDHLVTISGLHNALKEGETSAEDLMREVKNAALEKATGQMEEAAAKAQSQKAAKPAGKPQQAQDKAAPASDEGETKPKEKPDADPEQESAFAGLVDLIKRELAEAADAGGVEAVLELYADQIEQTAGTKFESEINEAADARREEVAA